MILAGEYDMKALVDIWERSVVYTHHFLAEGDFEYYKAKIESYIKECVILTYSEKGSAAGFAGISGRKLDLLFVDPCYFRCGVGSALVKTALDSYGVNCVNVNADNFTAVQFYKKIGFKIKYSYVCDNYQLYFMEYNPRSKY